MRFFQIGLIISAVFNILDFAPIFDPKTERLMWALVMSGFLLMISLTIAISIAQQEIVRAIRESKKGETK